jgi:hypothetical protein
MTHVEFIERVRNCHDQAEMKYLLDWAIKNARERLEKIYEMGKCERETS